MDPAIERIKERYEQLARRDDLNFMRQLAGYLFTLDSERAVRVILDDLRRDAQRAMREFGKIHGALVDEAVAIRGRLVRDAPEIEPCGILHAVQHVARPIQRGDVS